MSHEAESSEPEWYYDRFRREHTEKNTEKHTHTHTHTQRERARDRETERQRDRQRGDGRRRLLPLLRCVLRSDLRPRRGRVLRELLLLLARLRAGRDARLPGGAVVRATGLLRRGLRDFGEFFFSVPSRLDLLLSCWSVLCAVGRRCHDDALVAELDRHPAHRRHCDQLRD